MADKGGFAYDAEAVAGLRSSIRKARPAHVKRPAAPEVTEVSAERISEPLARLTYLAEVIVEGRTKAIRDLIGHLHRADMLVCITDQALGRAVPYAGTPPSHSPPKSKPGPEPSPSPQAPPSPPSNG